MRTTAANVPSGSSHSFHDFPMVPPLRHPARHLLPTSLCLLACLTGPAGCLAGRGQINDAARSEEKAPGLQDTEILYALFWSTPEDTQPGGTVTRSLCKRTKPDMRFDEQRNGLPADITRATCKERVDNVPLADFRERLGATLKAMIYTDEQKERTLQVAEMMRQISVANTSIKALEGDSSAMATSIARTLERRISDYTARMEILNGGYTELKDRFEGATAAVNWIVNEAMPANLIFDLAPQSPFTGEDWTLMGDVVARAYAETLDAQPKGQARPGFSLSNLDEDFESVMASDHSLSIERSYTWGTFRQVTDPHTKVTTAVPFYLLSEKNYTDYVGSNNVAFHPIYEDRPVDWPRLGAKVTDKTEVKKNGATISRSDVQFLRDQHLPICEISPASQDFSSTALALNGRYSYDPGPDPVWPLMYFKRSGATADKKVAQGFWFQCGFVDGVIVDERTGTLSSILLTPTRPAGMGQSNWAGSRLSWRAVVRMLHIIDSSLEKRLTQGEP